MMSRSLCACLLNVSAARDGKLVEKIAYSALSINQPGMGMRAAVMNIFQDIDYNRSVITIVSDLDNMEIASDVASLVPGTSFFMFGHADPPLCRGLAERRRQQGWFGGCHQSSYEYIRQDVGARPSARYGITGIGSIPYVTNCNVTINTSDVEFGKKIALSLRGSQPGGLPNVQSMAFAHEGEVEIACNIEGMHKDEDRIRNMNQCELNELVCSFDSFYHVPATLIQQRVQDMAHTRGISTRPEADIVGFCPDELYRLASSVLEQGVWADYWKLSSAPRSM